MADSGTRRDLGTIEVATVLDVAPNTVRAWVDSGTLRARRLPAAPGRRQGNLRFAWTDVLVLAKQMDLEIAHPDDRK